MPHHFDIGKQTGASYLVEGPKQLLSLEERFQISLHARTLQELEEEAAREPRPARKPAPPAPKRASTSPVISKPPTAVGRRRGPVHFG